MAEQRKGEETGNQNQITHIAGLGEGSGSDSEMGSPWRALKRDGHDFTAALKSSLALTAVRVD